MSAVRRTTATATSSWAKSSKSFARHGLPIADNNVELVPGLFEDTLALDEPVALAHLDGDWYASTMYLPDPDRSAAVGRLVAS